MDRLTIEQRKNFLVEFLNIIDGEIESIFQDKRYILNYQQVKKQLLNHADACGTDHYAAKVIQILLDEVEEITAAEYAELKKDLPFEIRHPESKGLEPGYILKD